MRKLSLNIYAQIIAKDLFSVLKEKYEGDLSSLVSEKVRVVAGDIACEEDLGVKDSDLMEEMLEQVDVVVNLAATVKFDERLKLRKKIKIKR